MLEQKEKERKNERMRVARQMSIGGRGLVINH